MPKEVGCCRKKAVEGAQLPSTALAKGVPMSTSRALTSPVSLLLSAFLLLSAVIPDPGGVAVGPAAEAGAAVVLDAVRVASKALSCSRMSRRRARSSTASRFHSFAGGVEAGAAEKVGTRDAWCCDSRTQSAITKKPFLLAINNS